MDISEAMPAPRFTIGELVKDSQGTAFEVWGVLFMGLGPRGPGKPVYASFLYVLAERGRAKDRPLSKFDWVEEGSLEAIHRK